MSDRNGSPPKEEKRGFSRRLFMKGMGGGMVSASAVSGGLLAVSEARQAAAQEDAQGPGLTRITLKINGRTYNVNAEPRETLLDVLRSRLDLTGSKLVCNHGSCGACTVHVDGKAAYGCMMLAIQAQGKEIRTIEGLADGDNLHPVQEAFIETDALQCGFCTPGFVMAMSAYLEENPKADMDQIKEGISGNLCRCGTYTQMIEAAEVAKRKIGG